MARVQITAELACAPERVWETVTDLTHQSWRSDVERVEPTGEGTFVEYAAGGVATVFTVTRREPPCHWAFDLENENIKGSWAGEFHPAAGGCRVTFIEEVTPKKAWMRPLAGLYLRRQQRRYLQDLKTALGL
ncbi:SRPBCC family protein [Oscillibacter sp.]|jgi:hypothetical protein|uniref:SRPBCC family protein n=1 Tax=Oscillibacter sp. TaxID=1945593 RepID=UPI00217485BD|nr:SRPBCC family protein [Oscillibacter sp.]MCI9649720.1 SRPBCC family protein [Oscillibacter sp.]